MHIINGLPIADEYLFSHVDEVISSIKKSLNFEHDIDYVVEVLNTFSNLIAKENPELSSFCAKKNVLTKIKRELGDEPFSLKRVNFKEHIFESWRPLGILTHILPGNAPELPIYALIEGILSGNYNIVKMSATSDDSIFRLLKIFSKCDTRGSISKKLAIIRISSSAKDILNRFIAISNGVSAWGGDSAIAAIRDSLPPATRFIPWGHKISFAYFSKATRTNQVDIKKLAVEIVANNQQACSAPQFVYCEDSSFEELITFANHLGDNLEKLSVENPLGILERSDQTEITNVIQLAKLESLIEPKIVLESQTQNWRIIVEEDSWPKASPLNRTIYVKPISRKDIISSLFPIRNYLQSVGLSSEQIGYNEIVNLLLSAGVTRVTEIGEMLSSYIGEPHDGVYALARFCSKVSLNSSIVQKYSRVDLINAKNIPFDDGTMIMKKDDFKAQIPDQSLAHLFFKSGGSSGAPTLSTFSYDGYHKEMAAAAEGLFSAGLDPSADRVMNCFFSGALYGGFLSFFTILEHLRIIQFPMGAHQDYEFVASIIESNKVNAILGMPSYLIQLFTHQKERLQKSTTIKKIFYGGEHFSEEQRNWLKQEFKVEIIRSATYGSVDAGPLGYQCEFCVGGEHHLNNQLQYLEILNLESDTPVIANEMGRMIFTARHRDSVKVKRYEIGDLGRWVIEPCKCGAVSPKFELLGRHGDIFRAGGNFLNYTIFQKYLKEKFNYHDEFQIIIEKNISGDCLTLNTLSAQTNEIEHYLLENYDWLIDAVIVDKTVKFSVKQVLLNDLVRTAGSGKLIRVVDRR